AFYRPEVDGRSIQLVRDGVVQLVGERMSMGSRIAVRGIFAKTFSKNRPWKITPETVVDHPKLSDLVVTQLTIEDGWLGIALGPDMTTAEGVTIPTATTETASLR
ncbi:MAG TPA: hypothetical protein VE890_09055, partial [Thermoguttaceae bacterium]|nr:hypothetical protein [Thermoguttaceae bacterium]